MKRQAGEIRLSDDIEEQTEENGNKRIKLLNNDIQVDHAKEKSVMDISSCENVDDNSYEDQDPSISNNVSPNKNEIVSSEKNDSENSSIQQAHETESSYPHLTKMTNVCNGSYNEGIEAKESDDVLHLAYSEEDSVQCSEGNAIHHPSYSVERSEESAVCHVTMSKPPTLNHFDHDFHNNESTDSFQSESFDALNAKGNSENVIVEIPTDDPSHKASEKKSSKSSCEVSEKHKDELNHESLEQRTSQEQDNFKNEFSFKSDPKKVIDVDNLTLSHLKVIELPGHTEEVLSVAADEDFILSCGADTTTKVWNMERQNIISTFSGHSNSVTSVLLLNPNQSKKIKKKLSLTKVSRIAITGSLDCQIKLWSVLEGKELASVYTFNGITCLGYLESDCLVVVGTEGGKLELWNLSLKKAVISLKAHDDKVTDIKVIDNYIYSVSLDGSIKVWSYEDEDISPVYSRKRKEKSLDGYGFKLAQWETVAVSDNIIYLGDSSSNIKVLDWRAGRLSLFKNQMEKRGICNCVVAEENVLFSSCYDSFTRTSGINVWKLPEMTYTCTLAGIFPKINNLAIVQKDNKLRIITGGDKLFICEFDFSKPPSSEGDFYIREYEMLGHEINENPVEIKKAENNTSRSEEIHSTNKWCNIM